MINIPDFLLCQTCRLLKNGSKEAIRLYNVRIDNSNMGMGESTNQMKTKYSKWILHYDVNRSSGLPDGVCFADGDTIVFDGVYPVGNTTVNYVEPGFGVDGQVNFYEVYLN